MPDIPAENEKAYLHVHRQKSIAACIRKTEIWVDGVQVGTLKNGESKVFEIMPGEHHTVAKMSPFFKSSETKFSIEKGNTQHFSLGTSKMNLKAFYRMKIIWLCLIPLVWFPYLRYLHIVPDSLYPLLYWGLFALLFYFVFFLQKKQPGLKKEPAIGGFFYQACEAGDLPEKKGWELKSLFRLYTLLICIFGLPYLTWKAPWLWHTALGIHWFAMTQSLYYLLLYFVTGLIYHGATYTVPESSRDQN